MREISYHKLTILGLTRFFCVAAAFCVVSEKFFFSPSRFSKNATCDSLSSFMASASQMLSIGNKSEGIAKKGNEI